MTPAKHAHGTYLFVGYYRYQIPSSMKIIGNAWRYVCSIQNFNCIVIFYSIHFFSSCAALEFFVYYFIFTFCGFYFQIIFAYFLTRYNFKTIFYFKYFLIRSYNKILILPRFTGRHILSMARRGRFSIDIRLCQW